MMVSLFKAVRFLLSLAEACCDVVRLDPGAEKRPDEESVVKDKCNPLLRNGSRRITVHLKNNKH